MFRWRKFRVLSNCLRRIINEVSDGAYSQLFVAELEVLSL